MAERHGQTPSIWMNVRFEGKRYMKTDKTEPLFLFSKSDTIRKSKMSKGGMSVFRHFLLFRKGYTSKGAASAAISSYRSVMGSPLDWKAAAEKGTPAAEQGYTPKP